MKGEDVGVSRRELDAADLTGVKWPLAGYAPGNYCRSCRSCERIMWNCDKRARQCLACAINELREEHEAMGRAAVAKARGGDA